MLSYHLRDMSDVHYYEKAIVKSFVIYCIILRYSFNQTTSLASALASYDQLDVRSMSHLSAKDRNCRPKFTIYYIKYEVAHYLIPRMTA